VRPSRYARWSTRDRGLAEALIAWEDSLCPGCGQPIDRAWDPRSEGEYEAHEHICEACKAKAAREKDGREHQAGRYVTVAATASVQPQDLATDSTAR